MKNVRIEFFTLFPQRPALVMTDAVQAEEPNGHNRVGNPSGAGGATNTSRSDSVTCPSCHVTVTLSRSLESRRRLVCPYCGAMYNHVDARVRAMPPPPSRDPLQHLRLPIVVSSVKTFLALILLYSLKVFRSGYYINSMKTIQKGN